MFFPMRSQAIAIVLSCAFLFIAESPARDPIEWKPVTKAELEMSAPVVDPEADAEAIFWDVTLDDKKSGRMTLSHYVRVKIFTERGRERFSKFDIPFSKRFKVENVAARVIRPDGSIVNLNPGDIFEREIVRAGKLRISAKSFAVPGIEPGVIVEYQYDEIRKGDSANGERLWFQRDIPLQKVSYFVRPFKNRPLRTVSYNMSGDTRFVADGERKGFFGLTRSNIPALKDEPYMPPDDEVRRWVYLKYDSFGSTFQWSFLSIGMGRAFQELTKPNKQIESKAKELVEGATNDEEKLRRLYEFAQSEIRNTTFDTSITDEQRERFKIKDADDVLRQRAGSPLLIDVLFASFARSLGFRTNVVFSGDRSEQFFNPDRYVDIDFVHPCCVAVNVGGKWRYFNPGSPYLPFGRLVWFEENTSAMLIGENGHVWAIPPITLAADSYARRKGVFSIRENGDLEGTVRIEYGGQQAVINRMDSWSKSESKLEEDFKSSFTENMAAAEISELAIDNLREPSKPLVYSFRLRVPDYAQKTGKRLFVQPAVFEYGSSPVFSSSTRDYDIYFPYPWSEEDEIELTYPEGFEPEDAASPGNVADKGGVSGLNISVSTDEERRRIYYKRDFRFGDGSIYFKVSSYPGLKTLFDLFHQKDHKSITLRRIDEQ